MKNLKKVLVAASLCAAISATAIAGTLAYFTDTETKTNTFTVGDLSIVLDEPNWVDQNATNVVPGRTISKDPGVTIEKDSVASYVRVVVEMPAVVYANSNFYHSNNNALVLFNEQSEDLTVNEDASDLINEETVKVVLDYGVQPSTYDGDVDLGNIFESITFSGDITNQDGDALYAAMAAGNWNIKVTAYATQAEGFEMTGADAAFAAAFDEFKSIG